MKHSSHEACSSNTMTSLHPANISKNHELVEIHLLCICPCLKLNFKKQKDQDDAHNQAKSWCLKLAMLLLQQNHLFSKLAPSSLSACALQLTAALLGFPLLFINPESQLSKVKESVKPEALRGLRVRQDPRERCQQSLSEFMETCKKVSRFTGNWVVVWYCLRRDVRNSLRQIS